LYERKPDGTFRGIPDQARKDALQEALELIAGEGAVEMQQLGKLDLARIALVEITRQQNQLEGGAEGTGRALRALLRRAIEELKPGLGEPNYNDRSWQVYFCLNGQYVQAKKTRMLSDEAGVSESQYFRWRRKAIDALAQKLLDMEEAAQTSGELRGVFASSPFAQALSTPRRPASGLSPFVHYGRQHPWKVLTLLVLALALVLVPLQSSAPQLPTPPLTSLSPGVRLATATTANNGVQPRATPTASAKQSASPSLLPNSGSGSTVCPRADTVGPVDSHLLDGLIADPFNLMRQPDIQWYFYVSSLVASGTDLWIGYFGAPGIAGPGLQHWNGQVWADCSDKARIGNQNVNAVFSDSAKRIWVGTDSDGVRMWDGTSWHRYTTEDGLPSNTVYHFADDPTGHVWAATLDGITDFVDGSWETLPDYAIRDWGTNASRVIDPSARAIAFTDSNDLWVGTSDTGIRHFSSTQCCDWHDITPASGLGGRQVRDIVIRRASADWPESVWVATADGGVSRYESGHWIVYRTADGLPGDDVRALLVDLYGRVWAATDGGVAYFERNHWIVYDRVDTASLTIVPKCEQCAVEDDGLWTGTVDGLFTYSALPYLDNEDIVAVASVCMGNSALPSSCQPAQLLKADGVVTATVPGAFGLDEPLWRRTFTVPDTYALAQPLWLQVVVRPQTPLPLGGMQGDLLNEVDEPAIFYWPNIPVTEVISQGQSFTFTTLQHPELYFRDASDTGPFARTYTISWRTWMRGRYVGPLIRVVFTVRRP
jgi:hypothetical protein